MSADPRPRIGDKWSVLVVNVLGNGPLRFSASAAGRSIGISQKMRDDHAAQPRARRVLQSRTVLPALSPPRVEYTLTPLGRDLLDPVKALGKWVLDNHQRIDAARRRFDSLRAGVKTGRDFIASVERAR